MRHNGAVNTAEGHGGFAGNWVLYNGILTAFQRAFLVKLIANQLLKTFGSFV
jgi:hypothetical protein